MKTKENRMTTKLVKGNRLWGYLILTTRGLKKTLFNLPVFCVICGCLTLVPSALSGELENLKRNVDKLGKNQEGTETKDTTQAKWPDKIEIGYKKGLYIKTMDEMYSLKLQFLIKPQYLFIANDKGSNINTFTLRHGQMRFFGNFFDPKLKFRVMFELPGIQGGATTFLRDMWIDWQWNKNFQIKIGQFLVYYDHENLEPTWALQFVDRSIINAYLGFERDLGVDIHGRLFSEHLEYDLFLMNGTGRNQINLNNKMMIGGRIVTNILGKHNYIISDLNKLHDPDLAIGVAAIYDMGNARIDNNRLARVTGDIAFRYQGFSALVLANTAYNITIEETDYGFLGQIGFFPIPNRFEVAGRWAKIFNNGALGIDTNYLQEVGVTLNYYFYDHHVKLQVEYSYLWNDAAITGRYYDRIRLQSQLFF